MALEAFLIITPGASPLVGAPSPDPLDPGGIAIAVSDFSFGVTDPVIVGPAGRGPGRTQYGPLIATRAVDGLSPALLMLAGAGTRLPRMELYVRNLMSAGGATGATVTLAYDFRTVVVTDLVWSGGAGEETVIEQVTFHYRSIDDLRAPSSSTGDSTPTSTQTSTSTPTQTPTGTSTSAQTPTGTVTSTGTGTPTGTQTGTSTGTPTQTGTATSTGTGTPTGTSIGTQTPTGTPTQTPSGTGTATGTASQTATTQTPTATTSMTPGGAPTASGTVVPGDGTPIPPASATPELGSGELLATGGASTAGALLYLRRRARRRRGRGAEAESPPDGAPREVDPEGPDTPTGSDAD